MGEPWHGSDGGAWGGRKYVGVIVDFMGEKNPTTNNTLFLPMLCHCSLLLEVG
jgi:hypothetical protein